MALGCVFEDTDDKEYFFLSYCLWFCVNQAKNTPELNSFTIKMSDSENKFYIPVHVRGNFEKKK